MRALTIWRQGDEIPNGQVRGDLRFENATIPVIDGADEVAQAILIRLRTFRGEWFLDTELGVPYYENILIKNPDLSSVSSVIKAEILAVEGVISLEKFNLNFDTTARELDLDFTVRTDEGIVSLKETL